MRRLKGQKRRVDFEDLHPGETVGWEEWDCPQGQIADVYSGDDGGRGHTDYVRWLRNYVGWQWDEYAAGRLEGAAPGVHCDGCRLRAECKLLLRQGLLFRDDRGE